MLLGFDPFRDFDRLANEALGAARTPRMMPIDCYRSGDAYFLHFDLPGVDPDSVDVTAESGTLTVRANRTRFAPEDAQYLISERGTGSYSRQIVLGEGLSVDNVAAHYRDGVLTVMIPVAEHAKPRHIEIARETTDHKVLES